jgi:alpha-tubulin suppressor-like RCC1 family protein
MNGPRRFQLAGVGVLAVLASMPTGTAIAASTGPAGGSVVAASATAGALYAWGDNSYGELGIGGTPPYATAPTAVVLPGGVQATSVSGGVHNTVLAVGSDGAVYAWGDNSWGQLGNGTVSGFSSTPVQASLPAGVTATSVAEGYWNSLALASDGSVYAWGHNVYAGLGDGRLVDSSVPVKVSLPAGVTATAVSAGWYTNMALASDGSVYAWGEDVFGELGNTVPVGSDQEVPVKVNLPAGVTATAISAGNSTLMAVGSDGNVYGWGRNNGGELGGGTTSPYSDVPQKVGLPAGVTATAVSMGMDGLAVGSDGNAYSWGSQDDHGQLGNGTINATALLPVRVSLPVGVSVTAVTKDNNHALALGSDGRLYAWGWNIAGELGNATTTDSDMPVQVSLPAGMAATAVDSSLNTSLAMIAPAGGSVLAQGAPTSATVAAGAGYTGQLTVNGASGAVTYAETVSADSTAVMVSSTGVISAAPTLAPGTYTVGGTDSDAVASTGTWSFALTVSPPPSVIQCISTKNGSITIPTGYVITDVISNAASCGANNGRGFDAVQLTAVSSGVVECVSPYNGGDTVPGGYVVTAVHANVAGCGANNVSGANSFNAVQLTAVSSGVVECVSPYNGGDTVPGGYVVTAVHANVAGCGANNVSGANSFNAVQLTAVSSGVVECVSPYNGKATVPAGYVISAQFSGWSNCGRNNGHGFNAVKLN